MSMDGTKASCSKRPVSSGAGAGGDGSRNDEPVHKRCRDSGRANTANDFEGSISGIVINPFTRKVFNPKTELLEAPHIVLPKKEKDTLLTLPGELVRKVAAYLEPAELYQLRLTHPFLNRDLALHVTTLSGNENTSIMNTMYWRRLFLQQYEQAYDGALPLFPSASYLSQYGEQGLDRQWPEVPSEAVLALYAQVEKQLENTPARLCLPASFKIDRCYMTEYLRRSTVEVGIHRLGRCPPKFLSADKLGVDAKCYGIKKLVISRNNMYLLHVTGILTSIPIRLQATDDANVACSFKEATLRCGNNEEWESQRIHSQWWCKPPGTAIVDLSTDPRRESDHRRYIYVLSQSDELQEEGQKFLKKVTKPTNLSEIENWYKNRATWDDRGFPLAGDRIDVYDEVTEQKIFTMNFVVTMRFSVIEIGRSATPSEYAGDNHNNIRPDTHKKLLHVVSAPEGRVFYLPIEESHLGNLGHGGLQVTLTALSHPNVHGSVTKVVIGTVKVVAMITMMGHLFLCPENKLELSHLLGREKADELYDDRSNVRPILMTPEGCVIVGSPDDLIKPSMLGEPKIVDCSLGNQHAAFIDTDNRVYVFGRNKYGQLGTGDKRDRHVPTEILKDKFVRSIYCGFNHSVALIEVRNSQNVVTSVELWGCGCVQENRLPGLLRARSGTWQKLSVPGIGRNTVQLVVVKDVIFSASSFSPEWLFTNRFSPHKINQLALQNPDCLKYLRKEELERLINFRAEYPTNIAAARQNSQLILEILGHIREHLNSLTEFPQNLSRLSILEAIFRQRILMYQPIETPDEPDHGPNADSR